MAKNITITGTNFLDTITVEGITYKTVYDAIKANAVTEDEILEIFEEIEEEEEEINNKIYEDFSFYIIDGYICADPWDI